MWWNLIDRSIRSTDNVIWIQWISTHCAEIRFKIAINQSCHRLKYGDIQCSPSQFVELLFFVKSINFNLSCIRRMRTDDAHEPYIEINFNNFVHFFWILVGLWNIIALKCVQVLHIHAYARITWKNECLKLGLKYSQMAVLLSLNNEHCLNK